MMVDPIERRIAAIELPEPTDELDKRVKALLASSRRRSKYRRWRRALGVGISGALAAGLLWGLLDMPQPSRTPGMGEQAMVPGTSPAGSLPAVAVEIPGLDFSPAEAREGQHNILSAGNIIVSTGVQKGD